MEKFALPCIKKAETDPPFFPHSPTNYCKTVSTSLPCTAASVVTLKVSLVFVPITVQENVYI